MLENCVLYWSWAPCNDLVKFFFIAISKGLGVFVGFFLGGGVCSKAPTAADEQRLKLCARSQWQTGREHATQRVRLVHPDALHIAPHRQIKQIDNGTIVAYEAIPYLPETGPSTNNVRFFSRPSAAPVKQFSQHYNIINTNNRS